MPDQQNPLGDQQVSTPPVNSPAISGPQPFPEMTDMPMVPGANPTPVATTTPQPTTGAPTDQPQAPELMDIPPVIEGPKTPKKGSGKIVATILGLFLLIGAVGAGVVLVQQNHNIREKATNACGDIGPGTSLNCPANCPKMPYSGSATVFQCGLPQPTTTPSTCSSGQLRCVGNTSEICVGGYWKTNKNCSSSNQTCTNGNCVECSSDTDCASKNNTDLNVFYTCETQSKTCKIKSSCSPVTSERCVSGAFQGRDRIDVCTSDSWVTNIICSTGQKCCKVAPPGTPPSGMQPPYFECKTSCDGGGGVEEVVTTPTPTPTSPPPGPSASCQSVKAYDTSWNPLTSAQLSALTVGSVVRFTVSGSPVASIDKARFTITATGAATPLTQSGEITVKKPSSDEYFYEYTIPAGTTAVNVTAQVHHTTLNWF